MIDGRKGFVVVALVALWITGVFAAYYAGHKPFDAGALPLVASEFERLSAPWSAASVVDSALNLVVVLWLGLLAYGIGTILLKFVMFSSDDFAELSPRAVRGPSRGRMAGTGGPHLPGFLLSQKDGLGITGWGVRLIEQGLGRLALRSCHPESQRGVRGGDGILPAAPDSSLRLGMTEGEAGMTGEKVGMAGRGVGMAGRGIVAVGRVFERASLRSCHPESQRGVRGGDGILPAAPDSSLRLGMTEGEAGMTGEKVGMAGRGVGMAGRGIVAVGRVFGRASLRSCHPESQRGVWGGMGKLLRPFVGWEGFPLRGSVGTTTPNLPCIAQDGSKTKLLTENGVARCSGLDRLVLSTALGLGVLALAVFFIGWAGLLYAWVLFPLLITLSVAIVFRCLAVRRTWGGWSVLRLREALGQALPEASSRWLALFVIATEGLALLAALAPPWAWDSLVYHLTGPGMYLRQHRLVGGIDGMHFYFPPLVEMLFTAGMLIKGPVVANLIHWLFGLLAMGAVFCLARRFFDLRVAWLSAAIFLSTPSIVILSSKAYVDLALVLYLTLALWCALEGLRSYERGWLLLSAAFVGFSAGVKYTSAEGILALGAAVAVGLVAQRQRRGAKRRLGAGFLATCGLLAIALAAPWYLKNLAFTGNPFYPFLFGGEFWDASRAEWVMRAGSGLVREPWRLIVAPLETTVLGVEGGWGYQATIGPLLLALLPLTRVRGIGHRVKGGDSIPYTLYPIPVLVVFCVIMYLLWLAGVAQSELLMQTRLLFPAFGALAILAASAAYSLGRPGAFDLRRFVGWAVGMAVALSFAAQLFLFLVDSSLPVVVGAESEQKYLARHLGSYYGATDFVNNQLPAEAKVLFLWEPRSYYFQRHAQPDTILDNWRHLLFLYRDHDAILRALRGQGYTHVLVNLGGLRYFMEEPHREVEQADYEALMDFEMRHLRVIYGSAIESASPPSLQGGFVIGVLE